MIKILLMVSLIFSACSKTAESTNPTEESSDSKSSSSQKLGEIDTESSNSKKGSESSSSKGASSDDTTSSSSGFILPENNFDYTFCEESNTCGMFKDDRDGRKYRWIKMDSAIWMGENLKYRTGLDSTACPYGEKKFCDDIGVLYYWNEAVGLPSGCNFTSCSAVLDSVHQGICPEGWHIPNFDEIVQVFKYASYHENGQGSSNLRVSGWNEGENVFGFSAYPTNNNKTSWITTSSGDLNMSNYSELLHNTTGTGGDEKYEHYPLRCVKGKSIPKLEPIFKVFKECENLAENEFCDTRDGSVYTWKRYGLQLWMTQNLRYSEVDMETGEQISSFPNCSETNYNMCMTKGVEYRPYDLKNMCPQGWKLAGSTDWKNIMEYLSKEGFYGASNFAYSEELADFNDTEEEMFNTSGFGLINGNYTLNSRFTSNDWAVNAVSFSATYGFKSRAVLDEKTNMYIRCLKIDWSEDP